MAKKISNENLTDRTAKVATKIGKIKPHSGNDIGGPSPNPNTNLIIHDIALRSVGRIVRLTLEKSLLARRYDRTKAKAIVENRSLIHTLAAYGVTKIATRSLPGAALVGGGLVVKTLFDRSKSRRAARRDGEKALDKQAED